MCQCPGCDAVGRTEFQLDLESPNLDTIYGIKIWTQEYILHVQMREQMFGCKYFSGHKQINCCTVEGSRKEILRFPNSILGHLLLMGMLLIGYVDNDLLLSSCARMNAEIGESFVKLPESRAACVCRFVCMCVCACAYFCSGAPVCLVAFGIPTFSLIVHTKFYLIIKKPLE